MFVFIDLGELGRRGLRDRSLRMVLNVKRARMRSSNIGESKVVNESEIRYLEWT